MCWYRFLYIFYKQEIKHCLLNVYVNISVLSDLKLPASLEMIVHVDWKAGLRKSHIPCGTQFKCLVAVNEQRRHMSLVAGRIPAGSRTCVILYLYIIRWFVFVSVVSMFWSGRVQPGRYHRMLSFERALIGSCLGNFLWALPDSEYRCVQFGLDWNAHRSMLYVWGIFPVVLATDHVHSE
jgi:hypothetical protein